MFLVKKKGEKETVAYEDLMKLLKIENHPLVKVMGNKKEEAQKKVEDEFKDLAFVYLLNAKEADRVVSALQNKITPDSLKDMYASYSRRSFANRLLVPIVENIVKCRAKVILPNSDKMTQALRTVLENQ